MKLQNNKDAGNRVQLQYILYETNLIAQNFELMAERFTQITGYQVSLQNNNSTKVYDNTSRVKHSLVLKIFKFIFGGDDGNSEAIEVLKKNVERLFQNDQLQEKQLQELLKSQKLNTDEIQINRNLLKRLMQDLAQINAMLSDLSFGVSILFTMTNFQVSLNQLKHRLIIIRDALFGLQISLDILYNQYSALVSKKLTLEIVTAASLLQILQQVEQSIRDYSKLSLPTAELNSQTVYQYYKLVRFEITVMKQYVIGVLEVPLVDRTHRFTLLQIHNLPIPVPGMHLQVSYAFLPKYLAIDSSGQYVAYLSEDEIIACSVTQGGFCELNTAILPTFNLQTCEIALHHKNMDQTLKLCKVETSPSYRDNALSLHPNYWTAHCAPHQLSKGIIVQTPPFSF